MFHRQGYTGGGRGTSTGDSGMLLLHGQEYVRKRQQDAPRAGICPQEAAGCSIGRDIPEEAEEHQQDAAGCSTGRDIPEEAEEHQQDAAG